MPINVFTRDTAFDRDNDLLDLPTLDSTKPIPGDWVVPPLFRDIFTQWSALTAEHLMFNSHVQAKLERRLKETGFDKPRGRPLVGFALSIACRLLCAMLTRYLCRVHYRGGDKLVFECHPGAQMSWCVRTFSIHSERDSRLPCAAVTSLITVTPPTTRCARWTETTPTLTAR